MILKEKNVLITGAAGVIGTAIAEIFAKEGARLWLCGRSESPLLALREKLKLSGAECEIILANVSEIGSVKNVFSGKFFEKLDILVTAAGVYGEIGPIWKCDDEKWFEALKINLFGTFLFIKYALPLMHAGGKIITFSGGGEGPLPNFTAYASSKGGVIRLTESLSAELKDFGIEINSIAPGLVVSGLTEDLIKAGPERAGQKKYDDAVREKSGTAGTVSPEKAAALAVFLASGESDGLTGRNISAVWDSWKDIPQHLKTIMESDVYSWRRIKSKDRGFEW